MNVAIGCCPNWDSRPPILGQSTVDYRHMMVSRCTPVRRSTARMLTPSVSAATISICLSIGRMFTARTSRLGTGRPCAPLESGTPQRYIGVKVISAGRDPCGSDRVGAVTSSVGPT
jgi:hypothetical protein